MRRITNLIPIISCEELITISNLKTFFTFPDKYISVYLLFDFLKLIFKRPPFVFRLISLLSSKDKIFNAIAAATAPVPQERVSFSTPLSYVLI